MGTFFYFCFGWNFNNHKLISDVNLIFKICCVINYNGYSTQKQLFSRLSHNRSPTAKWSAIALCSLCQLTLRNILQVTVQHNESIHYALACILPFPIGPGGRYSSQADKWEINKLLITLDDIVTQCTKISTQLFKNKQIKGTRSKRMLNDFEVVIYFLFNDTLNTLLNDLNFFSFRNCNIFFI